MAIVYFGDDLTISYNIKDGNLNPAIGLYPSEIKVFYLPPESNVFIEKILTPSCCSDLGNGQYQVTFEYPVEVNNIGRFVSYAYADDYKILDTDVSSIISPVDTISCTVTGQLISMRGEPIFTDIVFSNLLDPIFTSGYGIGGRRVIIHTDVTGYFAVLLLRGIKTRVSVNKLNITRTITIPDAESADLFYLIANEPSEYEPI